VDKAGFLLGLGLFGLRRRRRARGEEQAALQVGGAGKEVEGDDAVEAVAGVEPVGHLARDLFDAAKNVHHRGGFAAGEHRNHAVMRSRARRIKNDVFSHRIRFGQETAQGASVD